MGLVKTLDQYASTTKNMTGIWAFNKYYVLLDNICKEEDPVDWLVHEYEREFIDDYITNYKYCMGLKPYYCSFEQPLGKYKYSYLDKVEQEDRREDDDKLLYYRDYKYAIRRMKSNHIR